MADHNWRFIVDDNSYADFSVSVSPAIEKSVIKGEAPPTVFLNVFNSDSITIGVNEDPEQVLDVHFCSNQGIDFRRRPNTGGAVFAGKGSAFLVYYLPTNHPEVPETTAEAFPKILIGMAEVLRKRYNFPAQYRPLNDIQINGRKLIPTSLKIEDGVMTFRIVINVTPIDTERAGKIMPMPPEKVRDKKLKTMTTRFTWLEREAGKKIDTGELIKMVHDITTHIFGETMLNPGSVQQTEQVYAQEFRKIYESDEWLYGKSEGIRLKNVLNQDDFIGRGKAKALGGLIWVTLVIRQGIVIHSIINGDWHPRPIDSVSWLEEALAGEEAKVEPLKKRVKNFLQREDVEFAGVTTGDLMEAIGNALSNQSVFKI